MTNEFQNMDIPQLNQALEKWDKKLSTIKTQGGLWVCDFAIKTIMAELEKRKLK